MKKNFLLLALLVFTCTVQAQIINFPDANFKSALLSGVGIWTGTGSNMVQGSPDVNNNGEIEVSEALTVTGILIGAHQISSVEGLQSFTNLNLLDVRNNTITTLDLTAQTHLTYIHIENNQLTTIEGLAQQTYLSEFYCAHNILTDLEVGAMTLLKWFYCNNNALTTLDVSSSTVLSGLICNNNQLTSLHFNTNLLSPSQILSLQCQYNQLSTLDLGHLKFDGHFDCSHNQLTQINLSQIGMLYSDSGTDLSYNLLTSIELPNYPISYYGVFNMGNNPNLQYVSIKNGYKETFNLSLTNYFSYTFSNTPALRFICVDDIQSEVNYITTLMSSRPEVLISSYCTFVPGGSYNTINGTITLDCGGANTPMAGQRMNVASTTQPGATFSNTNGGYALYTGTGSYTVSPTLDPAYFTVSPANYTYNLTTGGNVQTADFCVTPNGVHPDLEVGILPLTTARPGFDAKYKITYRNKGNQVQSGAVSLVFNDAVLDVVSANPAIDSQAANTLTWDFSNLAPFETREILLTLNVNSPTETPAVNIGDILNLQVAVVSAQTDETLADNQMDFNQTVVGSYDPNDKTVVEGSQIGEDKIDDYLHYIVRFQNTGTAAAENIVVKDMLDAKLDWSTLQMVSSSHPYRSTLTSGNKLEVFYEGINLPASSVDEEGSHGYIAFKVKPKNTLVINDVIPNTANIYFDFNFPIVTNTVTTTITALGTTTFSNNKSVVLYPNPAMNILNVSIADGASVKQISIANTLGQTVLYATGTTIDVSQLHAGTYFVTVETDSGEATQKFIKL